MNPLAELKSINEATTQTRLACFIRTRFSSYAIMVDNSDFPCNWPGGPSSQQTRASDLRMPESKPQKRGTSRLYRFGKAKKLFCILLHIYVKQYGPAGGRHRPGSRHPAAGVAPACQAGARPGPGANSSQHAPPPDAPPFPHALKASLSVRQPARRSAARPEPEDSDSESEAQCPSPSVTSPPGRPCARPASAVTVI